MNPPKPRGSLRPPPHLATDDERRALHERVRQRFGSFGTLPPPAPPEAPSLDERALLADDFTKPTLRIIVGVFLASVFAYFAASPTFDAPGVWSNTFRFDTAFVVVWGPLLAWAMTRLKLHHSIRIYLVLSLFIEPFSESVLVSQGAGFWDSILWPAAVAYYGTIKEWSGLPGASLPIFFFVTVGLLGRAVWGKRPAAFVPPPKFAKNMLLLFLATVFGLSAWGLMHGGSVEATFRQIVHLMQFPLIGLLFLYALRVPEDLSAIGTIYVVTALMRSALVMFIYGYCVVRGVTDQPGQPEWCTNHSDSVLFVVAILIVVTHAFEQRTKRTIVRAIGITAFILIAIALNNRRLAFVSLSLAPAAVYLALRPSKRKRRVTMALAVAVPVAILYVLIGSELGSTSPIFKPARLVMSVLDQKDLSSLSRDIENENLIYTMRQSPLLSTGFGFDYQYSPNNPPVDLTDVFANFRLIAHNGVLWMWSFGGLVGFTLLWLVFPTAGTLAMRGYRGAGSALERSAALTAFGSVGICAVQVWGDQGLNGYMTPITLAVAFAIATRLAMRAA